MLALEECKDMTGRILLHQHWTHRNIDRWAEPWEMLYIAKSFTLMTPCLTSKAVLDFHTLGGLNEGLSLKSHHLF